MCKSQLYNNETLKFSDISSLEDKNVPVVKEEVETMNFSHYKDVNVKKFHAGGNGVNFFCKQGKHKHCFKCNSAQHFVCDCTDTRNNINRYILPCLMWIHIIKKL